jgi:hypothetical protein
MQHSPFARSMAKCFPTLSSAKMRLVWVDLVVKLYAEAVLHAFQEVPYELRVWVCSESS